MPRMHRKNPGALKLKRVRPPASLLHREWGFQAAITPRGMPMSTAAATPVPVRIREGTTRWATMSSTGCPVR